MLLGRALACKGVGHMAKAWQGQKCRLWKVMQVRATAVELTVSRRVSSKLTALAVVGRPSLTLTLFKAQSALAMHSTPAASTCDGAGPTLKQDANWLVTEWWPSMSVASTKSTTSCHSIGVDVLAGCEHSQCRQH